MSEAENALHWIDALAENYDHEIRRLDGFDSCCLGLVERFGMEPVLLYDRTAIVALLVERGLDPDAAEEFFQTQMLGAWVGDGTPAFLTVSGRDTDAT